MTSRGSGLPLTAGLATRPFERTHHCGFSFTPLPFRSRV